MDDLREALSNKGFDDEDIKDILEVLRELGLIKETR